MPGSPGGLACIYEADCGKMSNPDMMGKRPEGTLCCNGVTWNE